ncbi:ankyrin repeat domain-containing protein [Halioxenophilus sp. WMMB6]|uniref:ankyrin repeat domain-containing protein n=1 Tax=Halioxenophilus sp. WMMB6 TaxID=3073815 RepID=UPI00295E21D0|nr:ankyrin repeat domain-containing protein [Halioxenophilus sp. WMMB6]
MADVSEQSSATDFDLQLNLAAKAGLANVISALLAKGAQVNACSPFGYRALSVACANDQVKSAEVLLNSGADLFERYQLHDESGQVVGERMICVALLTAGRRGSPALIDLLVQHGACIKETDLNGETLLHKAAEAGNVALMAYLIAAGLDLNQHKGHY